MEALLFNMLSNQALYDRSCCRIAIAFLFFIPARKEAFASLSQAFLVQLEKLLFLRPDSEIVSTALVFDMILTHMEKGLNDI